MLGKVRLGREMRHAQRRVRACNRRVEAASNRRGHGPTVLATQSGPPAPQAVPLELRYTILVDRLQTSLLLLHAQAFELLDLHLLACGREAPDESGGTADGICFRLGLGLFLLGNCVDLIEIASKHRRVRYVLGGFGQLEQDYSGTDGQEPQNNGHDGRDASLESLEEYSRCDDGGTGEVNVVRRCDHCGVEDVQGFLEDGQLGDKPKSRASY